MAFSGSAGPLPLPPGLSDGGPLGERGTSLEAPQRQMDNLLRLVYQVDKALQTIAKAFPDVAKQVDKVRSALTEVVAAATRKGASPAGKRGITGMKGVEL